MNVVVVQVGGGKLGGYRSYESDGNVYLVRWSNCAVLIDAGSGFDTTRLEANIRAAGVEPSEIDALLLTHAHLDHSGGAARFASRWGIPVTLSKHSADALEAGNEEFISLPRARSLGMYPPDTRWEPCQVARRVDDGDSWSIGERNVRVVETPGHSADGVTYLIDSDRGLIAFPGDLVFAGGEVLVSVTPDCSPAALDQSLRRLAELPIEGLYPGHGATVIQGGGEHVRSAIPYLDRLLLPPNFIR